MITIDGKDYYTWNDIHEILMYVQEHDITIEKVGEN